MADSAGTGAATGVEPARAVSVFILDDQEIVRRGLRDLLTDAGGIEVVGDAESAQRAVIQILALRPQVALLDVQLPDGSGVEVCRAVRSRDPSIRALMVTNFDDDSARIAAAAAGASGFVLKQIRGWDLAESVRRVAAGEELIDIEAAGHALRARASAADLPLGSLTGQERRVLDLIAEGLTNRQIGERLSIGEKTVKNYVTGLLAKLGFERRTQAAVYGATHRGR